VIELDVYFSGWGFDYRLGRLAESGKTVLFEFTDEARAQQFDLSPLLNPLARTTPVQRSIRDRLQIPGFIDDALPDGWGLKLMNDALRRKGLKPEEVSILDRLAMVGDTAFGALRFAPAQDTESTPRDLDMIGLAKEIMRVLEGKPTEFLDELRKVASPQGARPKAAVWFDPNKEQMSTEPFEGAQPWMAKFPAPTEAVDYCAVEKVYNLLAGQSGIIVPESRWFEIKESQTACFAARRFDRVEGQRVPTFSFAALLDIDFSTGYKDYSDLLGMVRALTRDQREVEQFYLRCVFNVVLNNRDDHLKNFSATLGRDRLWRLSPAFDLTFAEGARGRHWTTVLGEDRKITREHLRTLAEKADIRLEIAEGMIDRVIAVASKWRRISKRHPITSDVSEVIEAAVHENIQRCNPRPSAKPRGQRPGSSGPTKK
jgi:serine/threonine-protein kinase HipA